MPQLVTVNNIRELDYNVLVELLHPIYCKEIPEFGISVPVELVEIERLMIFFSNQYAYMAELWGVMVAYVRFLKRTSKVKEVAEEAMDKRDYLEKVMSATKVKYFTAGRLLDFHSKQMRS